MASEEKETTGSRRVSRKKKADSQSQLMELFLFVAEQLGITADRDVAELADVSPENVSNWRSGAVQEFKPNKLRTIKSRLEANLKSLKEQAGVVDDPVAELSPLEIEEGSGPADLQRQFRDRVSFDYLGHRFLYFEPMGALAWENLIKLGYDQDRWVLGAQDCAKSWVDTKKTSSGATKGPIAEALGLGRRGSAVGLDVVSLGPGEGEKEVALLELLLDAEKESGQRLAWLSYSPVDVSIPLLLVAARNARRVLSRAAKRGGLSTYQVKPYVSDFEEGAISFTKRLPTGAITDRRGVRLVLLLGNTFGNLRDEETFVRRKLAKITRPGDLIWLEVGVRIDPIDRDPLYRMTLDDVELTAAETNRRLLLEGPYRRFEAAMGRPPSELDIRIWLRENDDGCRIPGAVNFCHDLRIKNENRSCTMLYSRRYTLEDLTAWLEAMNLEVLRIQRIEDSRGIARVAHLLLRAR